MVIPLNELRIITLQTLENAWRFKEPEQKSRTKLEVWPFIHFQRCIGIGTIGESLQSIPTRIFRISARLLGFWCLDDWTILEGYIPNLLSQSG